MAIFNCCARDESPDDLKAGEPDLPPKKKQITASPQRSPRPGEQSETQEVEKEVEPKIDLSERATPASVMPANEEKVIINEKAPAEAKEKNVLPVIPVQNAAAVADSSRIQSQDQIVAGSMPITTHDQVTNSGIDDAVPTQTSTSSVSVPEMSSTKDIDMQDAPPLPHADQVVDEPVQPAELQPQVALPPPPPLSKRQEQVIPPQVPAVPEIEPEKQHWLLPPLQPSLKGRKCLILDLDETLVHSSFKILNQADFTIPVEIEGQYHNVYVIKRPGVDEFMRRVGELYEVVVFTASVSKYGDPLLDQLDIHKVIHHRLFRESCYNHQGNYVKVSTMEDLSKCFD